MKKIVAIVLSIMLVLCFAGCGNDSTDSGADKNTVSPSVSDAPETTTEAVVEENNAEPVAVGNMITVPFAELTVDEAGIKDDIKQSIKTGNVTRTTGPDRSDDKEFVYIRGTIKNTAKAAIDSVNITGTVEVDGYSYNIGSVNIIESDGSSSYSIDPLITYTYTIYAEVPNQLVENLTSCTMKFGFDENFAYHNVFEEVPVAYNYAIEISK